MELAVPELTHVPISVRERKRALPVGLVVLILTQVHIAIGVNIGSPLDGLIHGRLHAL